MYNCVYFKMLNWGITNKIKNFKTMFYLGFWLFYIRCWEATDDAVMGSCNKRIKKQKKQSYELSLFTLHSSVPYPSLFCSLLYPIKETNYNTNHYKTPISQFFSSFSFFTFLFYKLHLGPPLYALQSHFTTKLINRKQTKFYRREVSQTFKVLFLYVHFPKHNRTQ